ncbi:MAG: propionate--CoA ligase [Magnetococcales bacterium]|nr:propionate--CoA ligase [Magnetococcales bacterium]
MNNLSKYEHFYKDSIENRETFWSAQAKNIDWQTPFTQVLDYSQPPFAKWFPDGLTNLCHNAVDRHLPTRGDQAAIIWTSSEVNDTRTITYTQLHAQVNQAAALLQELGVGLGDRVLIYMPMVPETVVAMLACVRIGAVHSVVFGGLASAAMASRIDDATPRLVIIAEAGSRGGRIIPYKPLLDDALRIIHVPRPKVLILNRGLDTTFQPDFDTFDWAEGMQRHVLARVAPVWVPSSHPSYILYTSGTTGKPKGVQRDTGGHAVALRASMEHIFGVKPGEVMFSGSDIGWVVGHSYIVYAPLLTGATTLVYEGLPIRPNPGIWWSLVEKHRVNCMFTSPTAIRLLKRSKAEWIRKYDLDSLRCLFLAGEPLDRETHRWIADALLKPVIDNYWQTETGWPILTNFVGLGLLETKFGSPARPAYGYDMHLVDEVSGKPVAANEKGTLMIHAPLPPGCMSTVWGDDAHFVKTYFSRFGHEMYATFDYAMRDEDGYYFIMGRDDDVINVAGQRLGTREVEEVLCSHPAVAEAAAVGVHDDMRGQKIYAFVVVADAGMTPSKKELMDLVGSEISTFARPKKIYFVSALPKTRSSKILRRAILAIAEGRDPGELPTIEDMTALEQIRKAVAAAE